MRNSKIKLFADTQIKKEQLMKIKGGTEVNKAKSATKMHNKWVQHIMA